MDSGTATQKGYTTGEAVKGVWGEGDPPVEPSKEWGPVWSGAYGGMARTDPSAVWVYQGWAIQGWSDAAGASRIKALVEAVPPKRLKILDMRVEGIWTYFGNYGFFGADFIWTTLHTFGGNDALKGDMRLLQHMPAAALEANVSIVGTGATMEGIDQNPACASVLPRSCSGTQCLS